MICQIEIQKYIVSVGQLLDKLRVHCGHHEEHEEQVRGLVEHQEMQDKRIRLNNSQRMPVAAKALAFADWEPCVCERTGTGPFHSEPLIPHNSSVYGSHGSCWQGTDSWLCSPPQPAAWPAVILACAPPRPLQGRQRALNAFRTCPISSLGSPPFST